MVKRRSRGFTMIELLIALGLSMVGLLGLIALQMVAIKSNANSRNFAEATALAQEKIEMLQATTYASVAGSSETNLGANPGSTLTPYTRTTTVADNGTNKTITVVVSWLDAYNATRTHTVQLRVVRSP